MKARTLAQKLKNLIVGNATTKLMACGLALALWFYAQRSIQVEPDPVRIRVQVTTADGWSVVGAREIEPKVSLRYPQRSKVEVEYALRRGGIRLECEALPDEEGPDLQPRAIALTESNLIAPPAYAISVKSFDPPVIHVELTREHVQDLPVRLKLTSPPSGYEIAYELASPWRVRVAGRKDIISQTEYIETEEIDISPMPPLNQTNWEIRRSVRIQPSLTVEGESYPVKVRRDVDCRILLIQIRPERTFSDVPIRILPPQDYPYVAKLFGGVRTTSVTVTGPESVVKSLKPENIVLYVDVSGTDPEGSNWTLEIHADVINTLGADSLLVRPETPNCSIEVQEKASE